MEQFEEQVRYLKNNYTIISILDLERHFNSGQALPSHSLLITFDDGDPSVLEKGLPVLEKYNLASVSFVITDLIDSSKNFWCRWVEKVYEKQGRSYREARKKVNYLKNIPNQERIKYLSTLEKINGRQLTSAELNYMESRKMFIGNHTHTHPIINNCTAKEVKEELLCAKQLFEKWDLEGYPFFAYPNGNWDDESESSLKKNGIKLAFLFDHKVNKKIINPLRISRIRVDADTELNEFKVKVSGLHSKIMSLR
ncbi:polysaccharide deacetylase family protein [Zunongwangia sp. F363]|uniref:Polysaccharide deacetylase family protein n=1 Tax=Autumnicola tepida TaxID=3075595 RepID=A0ABU3CE20_9FLAO|nr:polysaccharide deacetylase family protein [Zunongwangia sp. F363]MDT0644597.1 polysaccharide deacetylase family protein [Zunongwangia sp. F363]